MSMTRPITYGQTNSPTYIVWASMKNRCNSKKNRKYKDYGGRGISFDTKWEQFSGFLEDMGNRPEGLELDRIDNDGNYCKENCRWTTRMEQCRNTRVRTGNKTGVSGVIPHQNGYKVTIKANYQSHYIGVTKDLNEAIKMRREAELKYWKTPCK